MTQLSLTRMIAAGIILAGLPFVAIAQHWHVQSKDFRFEIPAAITSKPDQENYELRSELNQLDLTELSGTDNINKWDNVYVHMASGPDLIAYPFGVSKQRPVSKRDKYAFSLKGTVTSRHGDVVSIRYHFETFLPSADMRELLSNSSPQSATIEVAVNEHANARLVAVNVGGTRLPYRVIETPEIKGLLR